MKIDIVEEIEIPEKVTVASGKTLDVKGPKGEVKRSFKDTRVSCHVEGKKIVLKSSKATKREKKRLYTYIAHIKNMIHGVTEGHYYELKSCAAHFPMNVAVAGKQLVIKNFLGEHVPRTMPLREGVTIKVTGDIIRVESADKELAGMTASDIELLTRIKDHDRRIFQDGCYIISRGGKGL